MKHKQELIDILMNDAKLQFEYADKEGNTCAIGGIAAAFGWNPKPLKGEINQQGVDALLKKSRASIMPPLKKAIEYFGLTKEQVKALQRCNDAFSDTEVRHMRLKEDVESWEEE